MKIRSKLLTKLIAIVIVGCLKLLFRTTRIEIICELPELNPYEYDGPKRFLYCVWHDLMAFPIFAGKHTHTSALVSRHQDGSFLAESMRLVGISAVRGSTKRGGTQAVRQLMSVAENKHIVITPDGPRGPRRKIKNGIVFLASHSGRPIVPLAVSCRRFRRIRGSWTDMLLPLPFTKAYLLAGTPIHVPPGLTRDELNRYAEVLQHAMETLQTEADRLVTGIEQHPPELKSAA
jgi:lysophospholipid acyltransferase (LPLAT)-like uncharacterized protein